VITHIERLKRLKIVAEKLGNGWIFNELLSENSRRYILNNRKGLYLLVRVVYGSNIEQWELCVKDNNHRDHYLGIGSIGCSLEKSYSSIIADLKNRLLSKENEAYKKLIDLAKEKSIKAAVIENRNHVINSLKKVLNIKQTRHRHDDSYTIINDEESEIAGFDFLYGNTDKFNLKLRGVSSADIIKIMGLLGHKLKGC